MHTTLDLVYRYRNLIGRCELGAGLNFDEIEELTAIESLFAQELESRTGSAEDLAGAPTDGGSASASVDLRAVLRNRSLHDEVQMVSLGPSGCTVRRAPYADEDDLVEVMLDQPDACLSYRFKARVAWLRDDEDDDFALGLVFVGTPLLIRYSTSGASFARLRSVMHRIAA